MSRIIRLIAWPMKQRSARGKWLRLYALNIAINLAIFFVISTSSAAAHITRLIPNSATAGGPDFTLRILGVDLDQSDRVAWNDQPIMTRFETGELRVTIPASFIAHPGTATVKLIDDPDSTTLVFTITQDTGCSFSILPARSIFEADPPNADDRAATISVSDPNKCGWKATTDSPSWISFFTNSGIGDGSIHIQASVNTGGARSGLVIVNGKAIHEVHQAAAGCPVFLICLFFPDADLCPSASAPGRARRFRDNVLARTSRGRGYTHLYYKFASEAVSMMTLHPSLILRSREILTRYKPVLDSMIKGEQVTLTHGDLDEIESFLNSFALKGSTELRETIKDLCRDLRDPQIHREFKITVGEGPKREISANNPYSIFTSTGLIFAPGGLFMVCFYRNPAGRKKIKTAIKRLSCLAILLVIGYGLSFAIRAHAEISMLQSISAKLNSNTTTKVSRTDYRLPLSFEANQGQADPEVKFISRAGNVSLLLAPTEVVMKLRGQNQEVRSQNNKYLDSLTDHRLPATNHRLTTTDVLRMRLVGANPRPRISGLDEMIRRVNYFMGSNPTNWQAGIPTYAKVKYENLYKGVDMVFYGNQQQLEYDFNLAPGADPAAIRLGVEGAKVIEIDRQGDLVLKVAGGEIHQRRPTAYQQIAGKRHAVASHYTINDQTVGIAIGPYDRSKPLVIDPVLAYATYFGGSGNEEGSSIAVDSAGNTYITGFTDSINFPLANAAQTDLGGGQQDAFIVKLDPTGNRVMYSTFIGGSGQDNGTSITIDAAGNAYITGFTNSANFPVKNALQAAKHGDFNAFVVKLTPGGSLQYSTLFGGSNSDYGSSIAVDSAGNVYVAGIATSANLPTANAIQPAPKDLIDLFVTKLDSSGSRLVYSTYLGGQGIEAASSIAVDPAGNVYLTGLTSSTDFPTANPLQSAHGGGAFDAFVTKLNPAGGAVIYSTYLGGSGEDRAFRIAVDATGNAYVTGDTDSINFPLANALQKSNGGSTDAFAVKLNPSGTQLLYSTYLGGSGIDGGTAIAVDSTGSAYVAGFTASTNFPSVNPIQNLFGGSYDGFIAKFNSSGSTLDYSTHLGGSGVDSVFGVTANATGAYVMGVTDSTNFPTANPTQPAFGGGSGDLFIARIRPTPTVSSARVKSKKLFIEGSGFDQGATILVDGQPQKTVNDGENPTTSLIGKKAGKNIAHGQLVTLRVRNSDGSLSNEFIFKRPE